MRASKNWDLAGLLLTMPQATQKVMAARQCLHGIALVSATTIFSEAGEMLRFRKARHICSYAGMVPGEHRSGGPRGVSRGGITQTGNHNLRHVPVAAVRHYQKRPGISSALRKWRQGQDHPRQRGPGASAPWMSQLLTLREQYLSMCSDARGWDV